MHRVRANNTYRNRTGRLPPNTYNQSPEHNPTEAWDSSYVTVNHSLWEKTGLLAWQSLWSPSTQIHSSNSLEKQLSDKDSLQFHENPSIEQTGTEHPGADSSGKNGKVVSPTPPALPLFHYLTNLRLLGEAILPHAPTSLPGADAPRLEGSRLSLLSLGRAKGPPICPQPRSKL